MCLLRSEEVDNDFALSADKRASRKMLKGIIVSTAALYRWLPVILGHDMQPLTYKYNCLIWSSTNKIPFSLTLSRHSPRSTTIVSPSNLPYDRASAKNSNVSHQKIIRKVAALRNKVSNTSIKQQARYKRYLTRRFELYRPLQSAKKLHVDCPPLSLVAEEKKISTR